MSSFSSGPQFAGAGQLNRFRVIVIAAGCQCFSRSPAIAWAVKGNDGEYGKEFASRCCVASHPSITGKLISIRITCGCSEVLLIRPLRHRWQSQSHSPAAVDDGIAYRCSVHYLQLIGLLRVRAGGGKFCNSWGSTGGCNC